MKRFSHRSDTPGGYGLLLDSDLSFLQLKHRAVVIDVQHLDKDGTEILRGSVESSDSQCVVGDGLVVQFTSHEYLTRGRFDLECVAWNIGEVNVFIYLK